MENEVRSLTSGLGDERRMTYCAATTATGVDALPGLGESLLSTSLASASWMLAANPFGPLLRPYWSSPGEADDMRVSPDGKVVDFGYRGPGTPRDLM